MALEPLPWTKLFLGKLIQLQFCRELSYLRKRDNNEIDESPGNVNKIAAQVLLFCSYPGGLAIDGQPERQATIVGLASLVQCARCTVIDARLPLSGTTWGTSSMHLQRHHHMSGSKCGNLAIENHMVLYVAPSCFLYYFCCVLAPGCNY